MNSSSKSQYSTLSTDDMDNSIHGGSFNEVIKDKSMDRIDSSLVEDKKPFTLIQLAIGWISMGLAILSGAGIGPIFKYM